MAFGTDCLPRNMLPGADTVLVRYGEVGTRSPRVSGRTEERLCDNLRALLSDRGVAGDVERHHARPLVRTDDPREAAAEAAEQVDSFEG